MSHTISRLAAPLLALLLLTGCAGLRRGTTPRVALPEYASPSQASCKVVGNPYQPLVVEWPAPQRAELEARMSQGVAVVRFDPCAHEIQLLSQCAAPGKYRHMSVTPTTEQEQIANEDELYAKMPLGAATLEGALREAGSLAVSMTIIGRFDAQNPHLSATQLAGACQGATHVIAGGSLGAFELRKGARQQDEAGGDLFGAGAGTRTSTSHHILNQSGNVEACARTTPGHFPEECSAIINLNLAPLDGTGVATAVCEAGSVWDGQQCIRTRVVDQVQCPTGASWDGAACVAVEHRTEILCPDGSEWTDEACRPILAQCEYGDVTTCVLQCSSGHAGSCATLGTMYAEGNGVAADQNRAVEMLTKACDAGSAEGCRHLAKHYQSGRGVAEDQARAVSLYLRSCNGGNGAACAEAGGRLFFGYGTKADTKRAGILLDKACDLEDARSCVQRSHHYRFAMGVSLDLTKARDLAARACDLGAWAGCTSAGAIEEKLGQREQAYEHFLRACRNLSGTGLQKLQRDSACERAEALEPRQETAVAVGQQ